MSDTKWIHDMLEKVSGSNIFLSLCPREPDAQFLMELGAAVWFNKPIITLAPAGRPVPDGLRARSERVIELADASPGSYAAAAKSIRDALKKQP